MLEYAFVSILILFWPLPSDTSKIFLLGPGLPALASYSCYYYSWACCKTFAMMLGSKSFLLCLSIFLACSFVIFCTPASAFSLGSFSNELRWDFSNIPTGYVFLLSYCSLLNALWSTSSVSLCWYYVAIFFLCSFFTLKSWMCSSAANSCWSCRACHLMLVLLMCEVGIVEDFSEDGIASWSRWGICGFGGDLKPPLARKLVFMCCESRWMSGNCWPKGKGFTLGRGGKGDEKSYRSPDMNSSCSCSLLFFFFLTVVGCIICGSTDWE